MEQFCGWCGGDLDEEAADSFQTDGLVFCTDDCMAAYSENGGED